jgi:5-formyltetrahydrofolate cyclo-ligase
VDEAKRAMREQARAARRAIGPTARAAASDAVARRVLELPELRQVRTVLTYAATPEELDPAQLVAGLRARGVRVAYPRVCRPGELTLHWARADELTPGHHGILEPCADADQAAIEDFDLVLVPGTAFDTSGRRLGMGGGFYDRLLARRRPGTVAIGLAFDEQVLGEVPAEEHDVPLDAVVTQTRTLRPGA